MKKTIIITALSIFLSASSNAQNNSSGPGIELFNGENLNGWYTFLKDNGRDKDPKGVFTVRDGMIRISGEEWGCITTDSEYENFKLEMEFKWGELSFKPRLDKARDSGVLLHSQGEDGGSDGTWMHSIECQVIEGGTGDFIVVGDGSDQFQLTSTVALEKQGGSFVFQREGHTETINGGRINWFARDPEWKDMLGFRGKNDVEKKVGEWNSLVCIAEDDQITIYLNGVMVNKATKVKPNRGRIQIQSEGAEIYFRKVELTPLSRKNEEVHWTNLLDEELSQWDSYLSYRYPEGYKGEIPKDEDGKVLAPIGVNQDHYGVFTVITEDDEPVLKISGEIYGCVASKKDYANYHLRLKVKWGDKKWHPRKDLLTDSGILYHSIGPHGAEGWRSWMLSQEFQVMEGHFGDFWNQANSAIDIRAFIPEYIMNPVADKSQAFLAMGAGEEIPGYCMRSANFERPHGEWNTLELICFENKSIHIVNGEVVMILRNSRYVQDGQKIPMEKGKIQLQSEASELFYKNIEIRKLKSLPDEYTQYYE